MVGGHRHCVGCSQLRKAVFLSHLELHHVAADAQNVKVVSPCLHQANVLLHELGSVVCAPKFLAAAM